MSKQRRKHHEVASRQHTYQVARHLSYGFGYKHKPRWRKMCGAADKSTRQITYAVFGPIFMGIVRNE